MTGELVIARCEKRHPLISAEGGIPLALSPLRAPLGWMGARCERCKRDYMVVESAARRSAVGDGNEVRADHVQSRDGLVTQNPELHEAMIEAWSTPIGDPDDTAPR
ncbi:hypothetical protein [Microbacterium sp. CGR1]|uniref:hypothetical protein n=1 Tax=Microbacterium sp. CGR1 TaxID=1696072 RepID=UPI003DA2336D